MKSDKEKIEKEHKKIKVQIKKWKRDDIFKDLIKKNLKMKEI